MATPCTQCERGAGGGHRQIQAAFMDQNCKPLRSVRRVDGRRQPQHRPEPEVPHIQGQLSSGSVRCCVIQLPISERQGQIVSQRQGAVRMCARSTFHHPNSGCRARRSLRDQARVTKHVNLVAPVGLIPCWAKRFSVERVAVCLQPISRPRSGRTRTPRYGLHNLPSRTSDLNWIIISRLPWVAPGVTGEFFPLGHGHGGGWARHLQGVSFVPHDLPFLEKKEKNMNRCLWPGCISASNSLHRDR